MLKIWSGLYIWLARLFGLRIDRKVRIWPQVIITRGYANAKKGEINISKGCELSQGVVLKAYGGVIKIGENTFLGEYCVVYGHGGVEIGANTLVAMHTCILSANHTVPPANELIRSKPDVPGTVKIGDDVWIGAGVKILAGVTIGDGCVIGAGAVVSKSLPPYAVAVGVPCRIIRYRHA
jgi:acetyltransferase-like isoleucine patch superfamily enzyme